MKLSMLLVTLVALSESVEAKGFPVCAAPAPSCARLNKKAAASCSALIGKFQAFAQLLPSFCPAPIVRLYLTSFPLFSQVQACFRDLPNPKGRYQDYQPVVDVPTTKCVKATTTTQTVSITEAYALR